MPILKLSSVIQWVITLSTPIIRKKIRGRVRNESKLKSLVGEHIIWWYGGIRKNQRANSAPHALVVFREIDNQGILGNYKNIFIDASYLGFFRIGTIWENGFCKYEAAYEIKEFEVDFSTNNWSFNRQIDSWKTNIPPPISRIDYPLKYKFDNNWLLNFKLLNNKNILIPCIEFFSRCYGRSRMANRILLTYHWDIVLKRFYSPIDLPKTSKQWPVKLGKDLRNGDVTLLAHILYDDYATKVAKKIYAQIESSYINDDSLCFLQVDPWFQGPVKIKVKGIRINNNNTFLGLQIIGCSDPQGIPIHMSRANTNVVSNPADPDTTKKSWQGKPSQKLIKPPTILDLTDYAEPDQNTSTVELEEPDFEILGKPRTIFRIAKDQAESIPGKKGKTTNNNTFSSGEPNGTGKNIGHVSIHAPAVMESHGILIDMWNACLYFQELYPETLTAVEWYTFQDQFNKTSPPSINSLQIFDKNEDLNITKAHKKWIYYDLISTKLRGFLVIRITINNIFYYIVEIQRRLKNSKDNKIKEENFTGLIFKLDNELFLTPWLRQLQSQIRFVKGIMYHLESDCPGFAQTFSHKKAKKEAIACEAIIKNAFKKMNISL